MTARLFRASSVRTDSCVEIDPLDPDNRAQEGAILIDGVTYHVASAIQTLTRGMGRDADMPFDAVIIALRSGTSAHGLNMALAPAAAEQVAAALLRSVATIRAQADAAAATALRRTGARIAATPFDEPLRAASGTPGANAPGAAHHHSRTHRGHQPVAGVPGPQSPVARLRAATRRIVRDAARLLVGSDRAVARAAALFDGRGSTLAAFAGAALLCGTVAVMAGILHLVAGQ